MDARNEWNNNILLLLDHVHSLTANDTYINARLNVNCHTNNVIWTGGNISMRDALEILWSSLAPICFRWRLLIVKRRVEKIYATAYCVECIQVIKVVYVYIVSIACTFQSFFQLGVWSLFCSYVYTLRGGIRTSFAWHEDVQYVRRQKTILYSINIANEKSAKPRNDMRKLF